MSTSTDTVTSHFVFICNDVPVGPGKVTSADEIYSVLLSSSFWAFTERAPLHARLQPGDHVLIYVAGANRRHFVAETVVAAHPGELSREQTEVLEKLNLPFFSRSVRLHGSMVFPSPVKIRPLVEELTFIKDKKNYGLNLRLPVIRIPKHDYAGIRSQVEVGMMVK